MATDWTVYDYEVDMFKGMYPHCRSDVVASRCIKNAITESLLLHTRNLVDILLCRDPEPDAINLKTLLPGFVLTKHAELAGIYGSGKVEKSPCWTLNKMLAHSTNVRSEGFDYTTMMEQLRPVINHCLDEVEGERGTRGMGKTKQPEPTSSESSVVAVLNASTSSRR
jgi:hypothetical protein